jgi:hypothetical protein
MGDWTEHLCPCPSKLRWALPAGARRQLAKGGRTDRWPQRIAIPSRTILLQVEIQLYGDSIPAYARPHTAPPIPLMARALALSPDPGPRLQVGPSAPSCARLTRPRHCPVAVVPDTLLGPGRRIGRRGDATRAPTQGPRPGWAARCRPSASRDWPQCDKSINVPPTAAISPPPPCHPPTRRPLLSGADPSSRTRLARAGAPGRPAATPADPAE